MQENKKVNVNGSSGGKVDASKKPVPFQGPLGSANVVFGGPNPG